MGKKALAYWIAQSLGWGAYISLSALVNFLSNDYSWQIFLTLLVIGITGVLVSHLYRNFIIRMGWLSKNIFQAIPRVIIACLMIAFVCAALQIFYQEIIITNSDAWERLDASYTFSILFNWWTLFIFWSIIYFAFHFFEKSRNEEIKNLRLEAMRTEVELNNLKAQLNPHFMFNSMNSIRALIEENPELAKESITKLSNILRSTLLMGRKQLVTVEEEMNVIFDYLKLESIRYEERLDVQLDVNEKVHKCLIPPLMIQTLVENAIKHGISKLPEGGSVMIYIQPRDKKLLVCVENSGHYNPREKSVTGIGLVNTKHRLDLLFAREASFSISNNGNKRVKAEIVLPLTEYYESNHH
ncbi:MAG: sensor histidine kinase [Bacteroidota bacterium]